RLYIDHKNEKSRGDCGLVGVPIKKILAIFSLTILLIPLGNVFAFSNGQTATVVIGQGSFTTGTSGTTATTLHSPLGISFDSAGNLWVVDFNNNRILKYVAPITTGEAATVVIGQGTFTTDTFGTTATRFNDRGSI